MEKSREAFEEFLKDLPPGVYRSTSRGVLGEYASEAVELAWLAWQASRKQALEEAAQVADRTSKSGRLLLTAGEMNAGEMRTAKAILGYVGRSIRSLEGNAKETT